MNKIYFFTILTIFISCDSMETIVEVDIPPHEPVLVLNGNLNTDTNIYIMLSNSVGAFSNDIPTCVTDANVLLYENNNFIDSLKIDLENSHYISYWTNKGEDSILMYYYKSNYIPSSGKTYKIVATHSNFNKIEASTYIPNNLEIYNFETDTNSNEIVQFNFSFIDDISSRNYYGIELYASCSKTWGYEEYQFSGNPTIHSNDPSFPGVIPFSGYSFVGESVLFTDALFNGQEKDISLDVFTEEFGLSDCDTIMLKFSNYSNETYSYYSSLGSHRTKGELGVFGGEVVPVYTNVINGLGVLLSVNQQNKFVVSK